MLHGDTDNFDHKRPPFTHLSHVRRLSTARSGHGTGARHRLYAARDQRSNARVLLKTPAHPGLIYQQNLNNEIATLSTINRAVPRSPYFPFLVEQGTLPDSRVYLIISLFDELPLATTIGNDHLAAKLVAHVQTAIEVANALSELHALGV